MFVRNVDHDLFFALFWRKQILFWEKADFVLQDL